MTTIAEQLANLPELPEPHFSGPNVLKEAQAFRARLALLLKVSTEFQDSFKGGTHSEWIEALADLRAVTDALNKEQK